jgi:hypothetical protein
MTHSGVPGVQQAAQASDDIYEGVKNVFEGQGTTAPAVAAPPPAPTLASTTSAANTETASEGQGQAADILGGYKEEEDENNPQTATSLLSGY